MKQIFKTSLQGMLAAGILVLALPANGQVAVQATNVDAGNSQLYPITDSSGVAIPGGATYRIGTFGSVNGTFTPLTAQQIIDSWSLGTLNGDFIEVFSGTFNNPFGLGDGLYEAPGSATGISVPSGDPLNGATLFTWVSHNSEDFIFEHITSIIDETVSGSAIAQLFSSGSVIVGNDQNFGFSVTTGFGNFDAYSLVPIPEPSTYALMLLGGLAVFVAYRRRQVA